MSYASRKKFVHSAVADVVSPDVDARPIWFLPPARRVVCAVLGSPIDATNWPDALARIGGWAQRHQSRFVCMCNVHSVVTARRDPEFGALVRSADMALPDGAPIAWALRWAGFAGQPRLSGPDVMWRYLGQAEQAGHVVSFYGSSGETLDKLRTVLLEAFPQLRIGVMASPPYRTLTPDEDAGYVQQINAVGTNTLFVSLGCPKQEHWMAAHRGWVRATMMGVGAAFSYHAGVFKRAPAWMQRCGMEWVYRLCCEPRRLAWRYLTTNSIFVVSMLASMLASIGRRRQAAATRGRQ
jgi:N-acetylglucosaminyldiphosphoundecaprenol N-acetyl-beta-D-mannosaminyltransferase